MLSSAIDDAAPLAYIRWPFIAYVCTYKIILNAAWVLASGRGCSCLLVESIFRGQLDPKRHATVSVENELPGSHCSRRAGEACRSEGLCNNDRDCKIPQKHAPDRDESVDGQKGSI